jgi:RHS repeat-associated protein
VNSAKALGNDSTLTKFVGYVSPYLVVSNGGRYTKHIYAGTQRIASKLGDIESFGADPRRVEYAGANLKEVDFGAKYKKQTSALLARYDSLGVEHRPNTLNDYVGGQSFCCGEKEFEPSQTGKDEFETSDYEQLIFFYHPDHLGSTALVTDNDGNVVQSVAYIPYGEVFIEERNGTWNTPYLFNGKELDEETGLYYYGARYLNPTSAVWMSVDPLWEKNIDASPYSYCHGNPVNKVDVMGLDDYGVDDNGYIFFIKKTDSEKDRLIAGVNRKKDGEIKGLKYDKNGELKNRSIELTKGVLRECTKDNRNEKGGHLFRLNNKNKAATLFEFMAENTEVEWSFFDLQIKGTNSFILGTSHDRYKENAGITHLMIILKNKDYKSSFHKHSHPIDYNVSINQNIAPSKSDTDFARVVKDMCPNIELSIYLNRQNQKMYNVYKKKDDN